MTSLRRWFRRASRIGILVAGYVALASMSPRAAEPEPAAPLARLRAGNERFVRGAGVTIVGPQRQALATVTDPYAMVLSCADARVPPEFVFNAGLGDLFVVRSAGGVVDRAVLASLEHGAERRHIPLLVVMGHDTCDVVKSASESEHGDGPNLDYLVSHIRAGLHYRAGEQHELKSAVLATVEQSINDAMSGSASLRTAVAAGRLQVVGAYYESGSGTVVFSEPVAAIATAPRHE